MAARTIEVVATRVEPSAPDSVAALRDAVKARARSAVGSLEDLEAGLREATDWRRQLKKHPFVGAAMALGLGVAAARVARGASSGRSHGPRSGVTGLLGSLLAMSAGALVRRWAAGRPTPRSLLETPRRRGR